MPTIFPGSASVGQVFNGYTFDGTAWNINGIDLTENYLEESSASATYLTKTSASTTYLTQASASTTYQTKVANVDDTEIGYLNNASANIQTQLNSKISSSAATANQIIYKNASDVATGSSGLTYDGTSIKVNGNLESQYSNGDEGGEIFLKKATTNTSLVNGVTIDINQNQLRFFENGGNNRGAYIDVGSLANGVGTNLVPGMTLVKTQTVGSGVTSVTVNNAFSAAHDNYEVLWTGGTMTSSSGDSQLTFYLGNSNTGYRSILRYSNGSTMSVALQSNGAQWNWIGGGSTGSGFMQIKLYSPYLSIHTRMDSNGYNSWDNVNFGNSNGVHTVASSYTGFTVSVSGTGTMSGGTIRVYGYNNG